MLLYYLQHLVCFAHISLPVYNHLLVSLPSDFLLQIYSLIFILSITQLKLFLLQPLQQMFTLQPPKYMPITKSLIKHTTNKQINTLLPPYPINQLQIHFPMVVQPATIL